MRTQQKLSLVIFLAILATVVARSQGENSPTKHFEKAGVAFDYPANWTVTESDAPGLRTVTVAPAPGSTQIVVVVSSGSACDFETERDKIKGALIKRLATLIQAGDAPSGAPVKTKAGTSEMEGTQLHGLIDHKPALGDVYFSRMNGHFVGLAYVRKVDDELATSAWGAVRDSLKVRSGVLTVIGSEATSSSKPLIRGDVLNGKAIALPRPDYPPIARSAHASGTVVVQVFIDEAGAVIAAHAISGHPLLQGASVAAARQAKFSPTKLCGEPVKVTGVITYNFVAM
ncbi:MAG: energy transducer TonB [Pyrinomonadaceae bacterium]